MEEDGDLAIAWEIQLSRGNRTVLHRAGLIQGSQPYIDRRSVRVRNGKADEAGSGQVIVDRNRGSRDKVRRQNTGSRR